MPFDMVSQSFLCKGFLHIMVVALAVGVGVSAASAQALLVEPLEGGTVLVLVAQPLADATTLTWPRPPSDGEESPAILVAGGLTVVADVEEAFAETSVADSTAWAPPVIVAVGGAGAGDVQSVLERVLQGRQVKTRLATAAPVLVEGGLERRLGAPGSDAHLRIEVQLPPPADWRRSSVEVLWELLPGVLTDTVPSILTTVEGDLGVLEARTEAELAEMTVRRIRLALAQLSADPNLQANAVAAAASRLNVRRHAQLEEHPGAALLVLQRWSQGGEDAVRELLFGVGGVTLESVREAAATWLPKHPGRARLVLPPRVFNPRFATAPVMVRLGNDVMAGVLERSGAPLAVICLRPVLVPDLDGAVTATILARIAGELRTGNNRPGWVRVQINPPLLEAAGAADDFGELAERVAAAFRRVAEDDNPVFLVIDDARRRALGLMAARLGVVGGHDLSPMAILGSGNLAIGAVVRNAEVAEEVLQKFWAVDSTAPATNIQPLNGVQRSRAPAPGEDSTLVVALELPFAGNEARSLVLEGLLKSRAEVLWPEADTTIIRPFVPGRSLILFEATFRGNLDEIESLLHREWPKFTAAVGEEELAPVKRRVAAESSASMSGVAGHARRASAVAAGAAGWQQPAEFELEILTQTADSITAVVMGLATWEELETTGAGVLPIAELGSR
jgi:hypothetical protein